MKLLLDENMPRPLASAFPQSFTVRTVQQMGWASIGNGRLLSLAADQEFDALITVDRGMEYQQNVDELPLPVIVMRPQRVRLRDLQPLVPAVVSVLMGDLQRRFYRVPA